MNLRRVKCAEIIVEKVSDSDTTRNVLKADDSATKLNNDSSSPQVNWDVFPPCQLEDIEASPQTIAKSVLENMKDFDRL